MDVPEKLYFFEDEPVLSARSKKLEGADIEYVRTDAFIEKALRWMISQGGVNDALSREMIEDFKNYMKGE